MSDFPTYVVLHPKCFSFKIFLFSLIFLILTSNILVLFIILIWFILLFFTGEFYFLLQSFISLFNFLPFIILQFFFRFPIILSLYIPLTFINLFVSPIQFHFISAENFAMLTKKFSTIVEYVEILLTFNRLLYIDHK